jgi:hypothetical protein
MGMDCFLLRPIADDPRQWSRSIFKEPCRVRANSAYEARENVAFRTGIAVDFRPGEYLGPSPWLNKDMTECVMDDREVPPEKMIVTASGRKLRF